MWKRKRAFIFSTVLFLLLGIIFCFPFRTALVFHKENTNTVSAYLPIQIDDTFHIIFTHSIHLTDVVEKYRVRSDYTIEEYEFVFEDFGIGMPSNAEKGERFITEDGKYYIKDMERVFPLLKIRNGKVVSEHRLVWGNKNEHQVYFNEYFKPGEYLTVKIDKLSLWQLLKGVKISNEKT